MKKLFLVTLLLFSAACASVQNGPDTELIETSLVNQNADFRSCYDSQQAGPTRKAGTVVADFMVEADGKVSTAKIRTTTLDQPWVEECILKTIQGIPFSPRTGRGRSEVTYPFRFSGN